jgi:flagellar biosynthesis component FlhA|tara:strand:- start:833 stop:1276 length:444 start_codon:yes stop_codon:yes gene_type:complete
MDVGNSLELLDSEFEKFQKLMDSIPKNSEKIIPDIVSLYFQATMVETLSKKLKEDISGSEQQKYLEKINTIQKYVDENFSKSLHPEILSQLVNSIQKHTDNLKLLGQSTEEKTKEIIENEARLYKELRELMSTKEFVEQYDAGIKDD